MGISKNGHKTQIIHYIFIKFSRYGSDNVEHMEIVRNWTNNTVRTVKFVIVLYNTLASKRSLFPILQHINSHFHRKPQYSSCTPHGMLYEKNEGYSVDSQSCIPDIITSLLHQDGQSFIYVSDTGDNDHDK